MIRSLSIAAALSVAFMANAAAAQVGPSVEIEIEGDNITVDIEIIRTPTADDLAPFWSTDIPSPADGLNHEDC